MNIRFNRIWDKILSRRPGKVFTTYRRYTGDKYQYYHEHIGDVFDVPVLDVSVGKAVLMGVEITELSQITEDDIEKDTYSFWNKSDFTKFLSEIYGHVPEKLIKLTFEWKECYKHGTCRYCGEEVIYCDNCDKPILAGKEVVCMSNDVRHFCNMGCLMEYYNVKITETEEG